VTGDTPGSGGPRPPDPQPPSPDPGALFSIGALIFLGGQVSTILSTVGESV
jgi:hypothetical protein